MIDTTTGKIGNLSASTSLAIMRYLLDCNIDYSIFVITTHVEAERDHYITYNVTRIGYNNHPEFYFDVMYTEGQYMYIYSVPMVTSSATKHVVHNNQEMLSHFINWVQIIKQEECSLKELLLLTNNQQAIAYLTEGLKQIDEANADVILSIQSDLTTYKELVELLMDKTARLEYNYKEQTYTKQEVEKLIKEAEERIEAKSKKFDIGKVMKQTFLQSLLSEGVKKLPDVVQATIEKLS